MTREVGSTGQNGEKKRENRTLNLWLTKSCEGTLKSPPKSFKLGHMALAFVTLMLRNIADAVELEVREEILPKQTNKQKKQGC